MIRFHASKVCPFIAFSKTQPVHVGHVIFFEIADRPIGEINCRPFLLEGECQQFNDKNWFLLIEAFASLSVVSYKSFH
jgi:hypothetical protein